MTTRPAPPRTRGPYDPVGHRRALLDAAVELFSRTGYDATSVQAIAERAGMTKGAFYHHFASKQALLHEIHDRMIDTLLERADGVLAADLDPAERLRAFMRDVLVEGTREFKDDLRIFFEELRRLEPDDLAAIVAKRDAFERTLVGIVDECIAAGVLRDVPDSRLLAFGIVGMCSWTYHWVDPARGDLLEVGDLYADVVLGRVRGEAAA